MNIISHCIEKISQLLTEDFKQIENGTLDFSTFIKDVQQTMRGLSVDLVEMSWKKQWILNSFFDIHGAILYSIKGN